MVRPIAMNIIGPNSSKRNGESSLSSDFSTKCSTSLETNLLESLQCPVCISFMRPPIYQCENGHTICSKCKSRIANSCPTCRSELGHIRCLVLEKLADNSEFSCKYRKFGCHEILSYNRKRSHEHECKFRPFSCPMITNTGPACSFSGDSKNVASHLRDDHEIHLHNRSSFRHWYIKSEPEEVITGKWLLKVFACFGHYFCLHFEAFVLGTTNVFIAYMSFIGNPSDAKQFNYLLEVGSEGRKLTYQGIPKSIREKFSKVKESFDGLLIEKSIALFFSGGDYKQLKLGISGRIWNRSQEGKSADETM